MNDSIFEVRDRIIVITGGLGQLGKQFSLTLLDRGAKVAILDISNNIPDQLNTYIEQKKLLIIPTDITKRSSLEDALVIIKDEWQDCPYGLINNAALDSPPDAPPEETGPFETFPENSWDRVMNVNVKGVFLSCQVFGKEMAKLGRGSIINVGSIYGIVSPDHSIYKYKLKKENRLFFKPVVYSVSKSALVNFTKYLAVYWGAYGVRTNLIVLGGVFNNQDKEFISNYCAKVPIKRMAYEDEYNGTIIYLMSDASSYMTGSIITLDGGWTAL